MNELPMIDTENSVRERYRKAAQAVAAELCCPVEYDRDLLAVLPEEILERDYGCGDPTPYIRAGDTVLDLGSGGGKVCYIAAQMVGKQGRVIGVDCNQEMLALARKYQAEMVSKLGFANVEFRCGMIQDLQLDLDLLAGELAAHPIRDQQSWLELRGLEERLRRERPLIASDSIDCVVSNCVLNLVRPGDRERLFAEVFRVVKRGGRVAISDIVADEDVPEAMRADPELWSGCISGAYREDRFLKAFEEAGFHGIAIAKRDAAPWRTVGGLEFRAMTVTAYKGKQGPCLERNQALVYRGPFKKVEDDDGHVYFRGERMAVCDKTYHLLQQAPYEGAFEPIAPHVEVPLGQAGNFNCHATSRRDPRETKNGASKGVTKAAGFSLPLESSNACCGPDGNC